MTPEALSGIANFSPLEKITHVLAGAPGTETTFGRLMPVEISLFEPNSDDADVVTARRDHDRMTTEFANDAIIVFNMRQIIGEGLAKKMQHRFDTPEKLLAEMVRRAELLQGKYGLIGSMDQVAWELENLLHMDVRAMGIPAALAINSALTNCMDSKTGAEKSFDFDTPPAANFLFWRDTFHITGDEVALNRMFYPIRQQEVALARLGLDQLGIRYDQITRGSIEGGDNMPWELDNTRYAALGRAERTSENGMLNWFELHEGQFKASGEGLIPVVIEGPTHNTQHMMHLDTYMAQVARQAIIHCREITQDRQISFLTRRKGEIVKLDTQTFSNWIEKHALHVFDMSRADQLAYAPNVLVDKDTVYITRDGTPEVTDFIKGQVANVVELHLNELTKFYGGAHCATTEFRNPVC